MSAAIGSALAGARTITATSSQGLALMAEVVYIAASMRAPIVMAVGNRALSGPINIHCDHSDSMLIRDSGVVQLFAENAQEAYDLMVSAPRLAEHPDVLLPVLVCQDGFTITHSAEPVALLADADVRGSWASTRSRTRCSTSRTPTTQGPFAMPDYYFELRHQQIAALEAALDVFAGARARVRAALGTPLRRVEPYRLDDAERVLVCLGSTAGTVKDVVDELRDEGEPVGLLKIVSFRPFPARAIAEALARTSTAVIVLDRADSPGGAAPLCAEVAAALTAGADARRPRLRPRRPRPPSGGRPRRSSPGAPRAYVGLRGEPMSRLKTLARHENGAAAARGGHSLCQGCGDPDGRPHRAGLVRAARSSSSTRPAASRSRRRASRRRPGTCPGCTSPSRTRPRSPSGVESA